MRLSTIILLLSSTGFPSIYASAEVGASVPPIFFSFNTVKAKVGTENPTSTSSPTHAPSAVPTTTKPTVSPSKNPSTFPSSSQRPSDLPSKRPTVAPSHIPSQRPIGSPTSRPSENPSNGPSQKPSWTQMPSLIPSSRPTPFPSTIPSKAPSETPSSNPSVFPSSFPSILPSNFPSQRPSGNPSEAPSHLPSQSPSETNVKKFYANLSLNLENFSVMDSNEQKTFEKEAKDFIEFTKRSNYAVDIEILSVQMTKQLKEMGAKGGLLKNVDLDKKNRTRALESSTTMGLFIELEVVGKVSYGTLPEDFSFSDEIVPGLKTNFSALMYNVNGEFKKNHPNPIASPGEDDNIVTPVTKGNSLFVMYIAIACTAGGLVLVITLFLVHKRQSSSQRAQEFDIAEDSKHDHIMLQDEDDFLHSQSTIKSSDPEETNRDLKNPYSNISNAYPPAQSAIGLNMSMPSDVTGSELETPTGSTSTTSLGINLSPEALYEANKQQQSFSFVPQDPNSMGISHSYPDQRGRLVYKSYICSAPQGALGIIIDTTAEGPMVHAIKPTSQLLGCIAPGDIVVGLDNIETRQMTAPALTRLMARKSQQEERKITLLRPMSS